MNHAPLIACHECDLLAARDGRCRAAAPRVACAAARELYRDQPDSLNRALAFTLAAMVLFAISERVSDRRACR